MSTEKHETVCCHILRQCYCVMTPICSTTSNSFKRYNVYKEVQLGSTMKYIQVVTVKCSAHPSVPDNRTNCRKNEICTPVALSITPHNTIETSKKATGCLCQIMFPSNEEQIIAKALLILYHLRKIMINVQ